MKKFLLSLVAVMPVVLFAATLHAADTAKAAKSATAIDWRYVRHEGRWWYWMPSNRWMVWNDSTWVPYADSGAQTRTAFYGSYEGDAAPAATQPAYSSGTYCPPTSTYSGYSGDSGILNSAGSAGYGWSWGPGTARGGGW